MSKRNKNELPGIVYILSGASIMFLIFRGIFLAEFGPIMETVSVFVPGITLGLLFAYWTK